MPIEAKQTVPTRARRRLSVATQVFIGLGLLVGLFFGEETAVLGIGGDLFIAALQITVIPYVIVALITSLGRMTIGEAKVLSGRSRAPWARMGSSSRKTHSPTIPSLVALLEARRLPGILTGSRASQGPAFAAPARGDGGEWRVDAACSRGEKTWRRTRISC